MSVLRGLEDANLKVVIDGLLTMKGMSSMAFVDWMKSTTRRQTQEIVGAFLPAVWGVFTEDFRERFDKAEKEKV